MDTNTKSFLWLLIEKLARIVSGIFITAAIAGQLGPGEFGKLVVALAVVGIFAAGASMGADHINTAELSRRSVPQAIEYLKSALLVRLLMASIFILLFIIYINVSRVTDDSAYLVLLPLIPMAALAMLGNKIQAEGRFNSFAKINVIAVIIGALVRVWGVYADEALIYFAFAFVIENMLLNTLFLCYVLYTNNRSDLTREISMYACKNYFLLCIPTALSAIMMGVYLRIELLITDALLGANAAGLWAAVSMFIAPWMMICASIIPIANRQIIKLDIGGDEYTKKIVAFIRFMIALAVCAIAANFVVADMIVKAFFGSDYAGISNAIYVASFAILPIFMGSVQEIWIAHSRKTSIVLKKVIIGIPLSIILLNVFIDLLGFNGIALAMVLSYLATAVLLNYSLDYTFFKYQLRAIGLKNGK